MTQLISQLTGKTYASKEKIWKCPEGGLLDLVFEADFPIEQIKKRKPNMWRYREAIPIDDDKNIVTFQEGFTPLLKLKKNNKKALIKQEHLFPSGSYKDRGASVLISKIKELGIQHVVEDSSGNAGAAVAAYCALAGIDCKIFVPKDTADAKLLQISTYGAKLNKIPGSREDTANAVLKAAETTYYASHSWNPYFFHGTKTFAFEIWEQLGFRSPDTVVLPAGNGTLLLGAQIGFSELLRAGKIESLPRIIAIQVENCAPLYEQFHQLKKDEIGHSETLAEGIAIAEPIRGHDIIKAVHTSQGTFLAVNEAEIKDALNYCGLKGFFIEPTSAAVIAGLFKYLETAQKDETVVSLFSGHGLKGVSKLLKLW